MVAICGIIVMLIAAFVALQVTGDKPATETTETALKGQAPDFSLEDINGTKISLSQYTGKPVLLHFMGLAGCSGQLSAMGYDKLSQLESINVKYSDKIAMVTVAVATCASCDEIMAELRKDYGISWIMGNDFDDEKLEIIDSYSNLNHSLYDGTVVLIDESFKIVEIYEPNATTEALTSKIAELL